MADDLGERTEDATPKRKEEARKDGQVAKSIDLSAAVMLAVVTATMTFAFSWLLGEGALVLRKALGDGSLGSVVDRGTVVADVGWVVRSAGRIVAPVLLITWVSALISQYLQVGWLFTFKPIQPALSKISPAKGFQRIFGLTGLVKAGIDILKVVMIGTIVLVTVRTYVDRIVVLPYLALLPALKVVGGLLLTLAIRILIALLLLGIIDYMYQKWKHKEDLKMTKQQVKDEMKQADGDPEVKRRRARMAQEIAMQRIGTAVPTADVIVTNPEHYAIAIQYDQHQMSAPRVVAKGADYLALRIRQLAMKHDIPIVERKPLARALYRDVEVGREVPPQFYSAIAEVLAYVYRLSGRMAG